MVSKSFSNGFDGLAPLFKGAFAVAITGLAVVFPGFSHANESPVSDILVSSSVPGASYSIRVPVVSTQPILTRRTESVPVRDCAPDRSRSYSSLRGHNSYTRSDKRRNNVGGQILGGLIGGAIGNQFGKGNGRKALTIAGAVVGSSIAGNTCNGRDQRGYQGSSRSDFRGDYEPDYVCRTSTRERVIETVTGYDVTYSYNGALHVRRMSYDPGRSIELFITAEPQPTTEAPSASANPIPEPTTRLDASRSSRRIL